MASARAILRRTARVSILPAPHPNPWQPPQYQFTAITTRIAPFANEIKDSPSWIRVFSGPETVKARDALPKVQWISAYEYEQQKGQLNHMEKNGITEGHWARWNDLHYKLVDNADKYLVDNANLDSHMAAEVWSRWNQEADEHLAYQGIMQWRYSCFTESNLEVVPPGPLREELRFTAPNDLHPDVQEDVWTTRQGWLPPDYRFTPLPDPMRLARNHVKNRAALLERVGTVEREWAQKVESAQELALVEAYCSLWRRAIAPTAHITPALIDGCTDLPTLQEMFENVFSDNGDHRLYAIAKRAAALTKSPVAQQLAEFCAGIAARDEDASAFAVEGVTMKASPLTSEEAIGAVLPADFSEMKTKEQLVAFLTFWEGHWQRALPFYVPKERGSYQAAWSSFSETANAALQSGQIDGAALRFAWWKALNSASATSSHYAPPLLPVRKDLNGTRFMLRIVGALNAQKAFVGVEETDAGYIADALSFLDYSKLSAAEIEEIGKEYPGLGVNWAAVPAVSKARLENAGLKLSWIGA